MRQLVEEERRQVVVVVGAMQIGGHISIFAPQVTDMYNFINPTTCGGGGNFSGSCPAGLDRWVGCRVGGAVDCRKL